MYKSHYQGKLIVLLVGVVICLMALVMVLLATRTNSPVVTQIAPPGVAEVAEVPAQCNALTVALGGCK